LAVAAAKIGTSAATKVPAPTLASAKPSAFNISKAITAADRDRPSLFAKSRVVGSLAPDGAKPASISRRIAA
jgi:hypothetical protein